MPLSWPNLRASLMAASLASNPVEQKNTLRMPESSTNLAANCSCKGRVRNYLRSKFTTEKEYFDSILDLEEIKKIIEEKKQDIENLVVDRHTELVYPGTFGTNGGKIFKIGKTEEDWNNLFKRLLREKFFFRSFSIIEKEDQLIVYFI